MLVLASGRPLLKCDVELPLAPAARAAIAAAAAAGGAVGLAAAAGSAPSSLLPAAMLDAVRRFIGLARSLPYEIPAALADKVTADLTELRAAHRAAGPEQLYRLAGIARLLALSHGESRLTAERWEEAKRLDAACRARHPAAAGAGGGAGSAAPPVGVAAAAGGAAVGASPLVPATTSAAASPKHA